MLTREAGVPVSLYKIKKMSKTQDKPQVATQEELLRNIEGALDVLANKIDNAVARLEKVEAIVISVQKPELPAPTLDIPDPIQLESGELVKFKLAKFTIGKETIIATDAAKDIEYVQKLFRESPYLFKIVNQQDV